MRTVWVWLTLVCGVSTAAVAAEPMVPAVEVSTPDAGTLVHEVVVSASPEEVWPYFVTPAGIQQWWGVAKADVDLRNGGLIRTRYDDGELGAEGGIQIEILAYEPERMIAMRTVSAPQSALSEALKGTWSVTYLWPEAEGRTRVRMVGLGYADTEAAQAAKTEFKRANQWLLGQLAVKLGGGASPLGK